MVALISHQHNHSGRHLQRTFILKTAFSRHLTVDIYISALPPLAARGSPYLASFGDPLTEICLLMMGVS